MRTLLYTGHDEAYKPLAAITVPRMAAYAEKHGMDFTCHTEPLVDVPNGIYWTGVCGALKAFDEGYDRAIYLDVDQLVTNQSVLLDEQIAYMKTGFHASKDWGEDAIEPHQFSMCGFIAYKDCVNLFRAAIDMEPLFRNKPFPEQAPMQYCFDMDKLFYPPIPAFRKHMHIHEREVFNCVPDEVCPGKVPEPWKPGDWCAHLTMLDLDKRVELANQLIKEHGL